MCARIWEKKNRSNFNWRVVKVSVGSILCGGVLKHFGSWGIKTFWGESL